MKSMIFKTAVIAVIIVSGWIAVFNIPDAVENSLPVVKTATMFPTEYNQIASGTGVITNDNGKWSVTVAVGESDIRHVKEGQSAELRGAAFDDGTYTATVRQIGSNAVTLQSDFSYETVVEVILDIDNPDDELKHGYTARADIRIAPTQVINIIPYSAILQDEVGEYVYVLFGNTAVRREILTGIELAEGAEVLKGLSDGDEVIITPHEAAIGNNSLVVKFECD